MDIETNTPPITAEKTVNRNYKCRITYHQHHHNFHHHHDHHHHIHKSKSKRKKLRTEKVAEFEDAAEVAAAKDEEENVVEVQKPAPRKEAEETRNQVVQLVIEEVPQQKLEEAKGEKDEDTKGEKDDVPFVKRELSDALSRLIDSSQVRNKEELRRIIQRVFCTENLASDVVLDVAHFTPERVAQICADSSVKALEAKRIRDMFSPPQNCTVCEARPANALYHVGGQGGTLKVCAVCVRNLSHLVLMDPREKVVG